MSKQCYIPKVFSKAHAELIYTMDSIIVEYQNQGYDLTVRQLYYQLVARGVIENTLQSYKRAASIINDAKLAGELDWDAIVDRTREFVTGSHWTSGGEIIRACANQYNEDRWQGQESRVFVIIEKEALVGVLESTCRKYDVPILAARGYPSGTVLREFAKEMLLPCLRAGQAPIILHLGDHDPSGIDMTRDLQERISLFSDNRLGPWTVDRIALSMDQIEEVNPPENPAKTTDSRYAQYQQEYGESSWELDALTPQYLNSLVSGRIKGSIDTAIWDAQQDRIDFIRDQIGERADEQEEIERARDDSDD